MNLSVVIITFNEEANIGRTLASVQPLVADGKGEIIIVDSGSTDRTVEIAKSFGAKVFVEEWKGFAAQKNSAIDKAAGDWILSLDADEEVNEGMRKLLLDNSVSAARMLVTPASGLLFARQNYFLGRWMQPWRLLARQEAAHVWRGLGRFEDRSVHEDIKLKEGCESFDPSFDFQVGSRVALIHHSYPTLSDYIEHMNRYSSLGAEMVVAKGPVRFSVINIVLRPLFTFIYNYFFRLGFLDGREGLLLHLYHAVYVSWKYAKAWELSRNRP